MVEFIVIAGIVIAYFVFNKRLDTKDTSSRPTTNRSEYNYKGQVREKEFQKPTRFEKVQWLNGVPTGHVILNPDVKVSGVNHRKDNVLKFIKGASREIELRPEPENPHDKNAVAVIGHWDHYGTEKSALIGYLPKPILRDIKGEEIASDLSGVFHPNRPDVTPGVRIAIFYRRKKRKTKDCPECGKRSPIAMDTCKHCGFNYA
jgi:hypothetical protein